MHDLLLHACCGPCSTVAVPAWRKRGLEPLAWFDNPNIQPAAEVERRLESMRRFSRAAGLELVVEANAPQISAWREWTEMLGAAAPEERCSVCLGLRLRQAAAATAGRGLRRFSTTLTVSPYQRHDLIVTAGEAAAAEHDVDFVYLDLRSSFRGSYAESRRLGLYRQSYCGCAASKWEAWEQRRAPKKAG